MTETQLASEPVSPASPELPSLGHCSDAGVKQQVLANFNSDNL
jgi:hypothetical protein